ncbi:MAG TPA: hypothetical protein DCG32_04905 [Sphaerochaeta sp.]|nr:hypothetical protein [Sphaerochaeta sp.]
MKKTLILCTIILLVTGFLFAAPSWIGVQGVGSYQQNTTTIDGDEQEHTANLGGMNIAGTLYPGESPVGIGFQFGASKTMKATRGSTELVVEDYPLTYNGAVMAKFRAGMSEMLALELGAGLMYERTITTYDILGYEAETNLNTLSVLTSADLVVHLSDSLALIGGVGASFPLTTKGTYEDSVGTSIEDEYDVKGYTVSGKVGVGLSF